MAVDPIRSAGDPQTRVAGAQTAELFEEHSRMVYGLCRALLRDPDDADDATQATFVSAYRSLLGGGVVREPAAWLATIARNECTARGHARMREPLPLLDADLRHTQGPEDELERRAVIEELQKAIAELPEKQREAVVLRDLYGLRYTEVGAALGMSVASVESLLFRARRSLRVSLKPLASGALTVPIAVREGIAQALPAFATAARRRRRSGVRGSRARPARQARRRPGRREGCRRRRRGRCRRLDRGRRGRARREATPESGPARYAVAAGCSERSARGRHGRRRIAHRRTRWLASLRTSAPAASRDRSGGRQLPAAALSGLVPEARVTKDRTTPGGSTGPASDEGEGGGYGGKGDDDDAEGSEHSGHPGGSGGRAAPQARTVATARATPRSREDVLEPRRRTRVMRAKNVGTAGESESGSDPSKAETPEGAEDPEGVGEDEPDPDKPVGQGSDGESGDGPALPPA